MNSMIKITLVGIITLFLVNCNSSVSTPPEKVLGIPSNAKWYGGVDGGVWVEVVKAINNKVYQLNIFNDITGEKQDSGVFELCASCDCLPIDSLTVINNISGYDGEKIYLSMQLNGEHCYLHKE